MNQNMLTKKKKKKLGLKWNSENGECITSFLKVYLPDKFQPLIIWFGF